MRSGATPVAMPISDFREIEFVCKMPWRILLARTIRPARAGPIENSFHVGTAGCPARIPKVADSAANCRSMQVRTPGLARRVPQIIRPGMSGLRDSPVTRIAQVLANVDDKPTALYLPFGSPARGYPHERSPRYRCGSTQSFGGRPSGRPGAQMSLLHVPHA